MNNIAIYGAGGFGREVAWLGEICGGDKGGETIVCFIDDDDQSHGRMINGIPVMGLDAARQAFPHASLVGAVGSPIVRQKLMEKAAAAGFTFETLIHPNVERSRRIDIGEGTVICAGCILTTNIVIQKQVQLNLHCTIGHDVVMEDYVTLAPGVHVSGYVHIGKRVYVGTGAVFINGKENAPLMIGDDVIIGAGACVTKSIPAGVWGGVPAKKLRTK
ncbi:MAG: acetyltransferase [Desulfosarcina sp.]|nr:acetyltransferase [Desulfosarcina sp.]MBC2764906.1 acetyltransferase [Desulfosarcina sp.]